MQLRQYAFTPIISATILSAAAESYQPTLSPVSVLRVNECEGAKNARDIHVS
jgi:hypothetical protein